MKIEKERKKNFFAFVWIDKMVTRARIYKKSEITEISRECGTAFAVVFVVVARIRTIRRGRRRRRKKVWKSRSLRSTLQYVILLITCSLFVRSRACDSSFRAYSTQNFYQWKQRTQFSIFLDEFVTRCNTKRMEVRTIQ